MTVTGLPSNRRLILASASPRRQDLLRQLGFGFDIVLPEHEEPKDLSGELSPPELAEALSFYKARSAAQQLKQEIILAGDTIATLNGEIFGKPDDRNDASRIMQRIAGTTHLVITGITLLNAESHERLIAHEVTSVTMRRLDEAELNDYLDSGDWQGKAGAYGIQDRGDQFVTNIDGSFENVVGLPVDLVTRMLSSWNIYPQPMQEQ